MSAVEELGGKTARGLLWSFLSTAASRLVSVAGLTVLARLLAPEEFGVVAFALVFITYVETVGDLGTSMALVYWPEQRAEAAQVTFVLNFTAGLLWLAVGWALAPWIAGFFHHEEATPILRVLSLSFLIKGLGHTHDALCRRDLRFRARLLPEAAQAAIKGAVAIALAWRGLGAWSLVWGQLIGLGAWTVLLWVVTPWRPRLQLRSPLYRPMLAYGRGIVAVNVLAAIVHHADLVVVGRVLGAAALGTYQMAYKIPELAITTVVWVTGGVLFPAFSRLAASRGDAGCEPLGRAYLVALRYIALVTLPAAAGLVLLASPLVMGLLGPQWSDAIPILRVLAVYACLRSLGSHTGDVLKATGRSGLLAALGVVKAAVLVPALLLAASRGPIAVASAMALVTAGTVLLNLLVVSRLLALDVRSVARALGPPLAATSVLAAALAAVGEAGGTLDALLLVVVSLILGAAVYALALRLLFPDVLRFVRVTLGRGREAVRPGPALGGLR